MKQKLLMCFLLMFSFLHVALAQTRTVSGRVTDRGTGEGLPGVTILLQGTTNGSSTNSDGAFTLDVPTAGGTLVFSSVGYTSQNVPIGTAATVSVALVTDVKQLNEVVVTGYGTQERRDVTGSIATIKGDAIANLATPSFAQQLAGRAAGVVVQTPSGLLGQQPRIQIRGTNSITSGTFPLVVVDGQPIFTGNTSNLAAGFSNALADINPSDIESYEVLKDGSATAIYGSRGANGVILITTKKGRGNRATVSYDTYMGVAQTLKRYDVLNAQDFITISNEKQRNATTSAITTPLAATFKDANGSEMPVSTDWQDEIFRTGFQQNHIVSVSGASDKTNYYFSGGYSDQQGVVRANSLRRFTFRSNIDTEAKKWLRIGLNLGLTRTQVLGLNTGVNSLSGNVANALGLFPNVPARNPDGTPYVNAGGALGQGGNSAPIPFNYPNIIFPLENNTYRSVGYRILGGTYLEVEPVTGLRLRTQLSTDTQLNDDFQFLDPRQGDGRSANGTVYQAFSPSIRWNWANTATYNKTIAEIHKVTAVVGAEYQKTNASYYSAQGTGISDRTLGPNGIVSGTLTTPTIGGDVTQSGLQSYFGRLNYSLLDRYLISFTLRSDALSSLPEANRRGVFPGGSVGWRVSEEPFFKNAGFSNVWSSFKIRGSYALVGNVDVGNFLYVGQFGAGQYASQAGLAYSRFGNDQLKWESSKKTDIGLDFGFFDNRITLTADYYNNNVEDAILQVPTPLSFGVPDNSRYSANVGSLYNRGFEFSLGTSNIQKEDFTWSTTFNISTNENKVTKLFNGQDIVSSYNITRVGLPVGAIFGYDFQGVNTANGNAIYRRADGTLVQAVSQVTGVRDAAGNTLPNRYVVYNEGDKGNLSQASNLTVSDKVFLGQTNPKLYGGLGNTFTYKGFDLDIFFRFNVGNSVMNVTRQNQLLRQDFLNNGTEILDRWTADGQVTTVPRLVLGNGAFINLENNAVSRFVESGSFLRLQNLTLGYSLPKGLTSRVGLSRVRIFAQAQNVFTATKYKGVDPEVNANASGTTTQQNTQAGIDFNANPQQRVFTGGLNVSF